VFGSGPATTGDVSYSEVFYSGTMSFRGGSVIAPDLATPGPNEPSPILDLRRRFHFTARLTAHDSDSRTGEALFTRALAGRGIGTISFIHDAGDGLTADRIRYEFQQTDPVPEPGTLLLLGSGAAMAIARRRQPLTTRSGCDTSPAA
jgi:hypothetical protein